MTHIVQPEVILKECLREAGNDTEAGLLATDYILTNGTIFAALANHEPVPSISAFLAQDINNPAAQKVLNRALRAARGMSAEARRDLKTALSSSDDDSGKAVLKFIENYRQQLATLLTTSQLASVLEGAREVAGKVPTLEEDAIHLGKSPQPTFPVKEGPHLASIEEAVKSLAEKNILTRASYDSLDSQARAKALVVAGTDAEETLTKIRDVMAKNVAEGASYEAFRKEVLEAVGEGTFLSDKHLETMFRTNVQIAFSDGQMAVLNNPLVRDGFPYASYDAIHDDRVRHNHLALEHHGINGTNIYRNDDPVFQLFRPPWDYNDRCSWTPLTVKQAARRGIAEARQWAATGIPPDVPAHVPMPPFAPPTGFQRAAMTAPLSIRLSAQPMDAFDPGPFNNATAAPPRLFPVDDYPRDHINRFLDKHVIADAAMNLEAYTSLRDTIPESEQVKLDRAVAHLQSDGAIHHPKEDPGLAVNINGVIVDNRWRAYSEDLKRYEEWQERYEDRTDKRAHAKKATQALRKTDLDYRSIDKLLRNAGATDAEMRSLSRIKYRARGKRAEQDEVLDTYEDVIEAIHTRLDEQDTTDIEPVPPEKPSSVAFGMVGDEWRGPTPPGKGWVPIAPGPRGGKRWRRAASRPTGKGSGNERQREDEQQAGQRTEPGRPGPDDRGIERPSEPVETAVERAGDGRSDSQGQGARRPARKRLTKRDREQIAAITKRLNQYARAYRRSGQEYLAELMDYIQEHISTVGMEVALSAFGEERVDQSGGEKVQYVGTGWFEKGEIKFIQKYLDECGITLYADVTTLRNDVRTITSAPLEGLKRSDDVKPVETNILDKLQESKLLPGLESAEDINEIMGRNVRQVNSDVIAKLNEKYGENKWIIKSYGDEAYAGFGVLFPQRLKEIQRAARSALLDIKRKLKKHKYSYDRNERGNIVGITDGTNSYKFNSPELDALPLAIKKLANMAEAQAPAEHGARLPATSRDSLRQDYGVLIRRGAGGKATHIVNPEGVTIKIGSREYDNAFDIYDPIWKTIERAIDVADTGEDDRLSFFVSPAFKAVGVTQADRKAGSTWESSTEGRVHVITKDGKASVVPYATLGSRHDSIPIVFPTDDIRAMEKAVEDAINALPASERAGQTYSPDVMKTEDGWRVVELNASTPYAESMWLEENPLVIDAYVSHILGREPNHVKFVRGLSGPTTPEIFSKLAKPPVQQAKTARAGAARNPTGKIGVRLSVDSYGNEHKGPGPGGGQFTGKGEGGSKKKEGIVGKVIRKVKEFFGIKPKPSTSLEHIAVIDKATKKWKNIKFPGEKELAKVKEDIARLGIKKYRKNLRSNSTDRRNRRAALLKEFGDGDSCPCLYCGVTIGEGTLEQDLILPVNIGGRFTAPNLVPSCADCRRRRGKMPFGEALEKARIHARTTE